MLLTSAPVAIRSVATPMLPLDLHVLSLSLAFILSQDQTLRCIYSVFVFFCLKTRTPKTSIPVAVMMTPVIGSERHRSTVSFLSPVSRNLDRRSAESLPCLSPACQFPHRKHFNDLKKMPSAHITPLSMRRQKNRSTRNGSS